MKKVICIGLAGAMLLMQAVIYAETNPSTYSVNQVSDVNYFETFADYSNTYGEISDCSPKGWFAPSSVGNTVDDDTKSNVVKMGIGKVASWQSNASGAIMNYLFGKTVSDGKLHISYNFKNGNTNVLQFYLSPYVDGNDTNKTYDAFDPRQADKEAAALFFRTDSPWTVPDEAKDNGKIIVYENSDMTYTADKTYAAEPYEYQAEYENNAWNKVDMIYDLDAKTYSVYNNGVCIGNNLEFKSNGIKGIRSTLQAGYYVNGDNTVSINSDGAYTGAAFGYFDNFYVHEYKDGETVTAKAEYDGADRINIAFSEYVDASAGSITVKNVETNTIVNTSIVSTAGGNVSLLLDSPLAPGIYEISCSGIKGAVTGGKIDESYIKISGPASSTRYLYLDEDFEDYITGEIPMNWTMSQNLSDNTKEWLTDNSAWYNGYATLAEQGVNTLDNSNAFRFKGSKNESVATRNLFHYFPSNNPLTGKFTVEFDVYHENGGWTLGYILSEDYDNVDQSYLGDRLTYSLVGQKRGTSGDMQYSTVTTQSDNFTGTFEGVSVPPEKWSHIKLTVDTEAGSYTAKVNNGIAVTKTDGQYGKFGKGIMGIRLGRLNTSAAPYTGNVAFDNVKIYKDTACVLSEDFDGYPLYADGAAAGSYAAWTVNDFRSAGGWVDPTVTTENMNTSKLKQQINTKTRAYGVVPSSAASASDYGKLIRADSATDENRWTGNGRVLALAGLACGDAAYTRQGQSRIQRYFDRPIKAGTPFTIEMDMDANYAAEAFGISLLEKADMTIGTENADTYNKNLLVGWTGNYNTEISKTWVAPNDRIALSDINNGQYITADNLFTKILGDSYTNFGANGTNIIPAKREMKPISFTVVPYYENGTPKAKITYTYNGGNSNGGLKRAETVTSQDYMTRDIAGIAFDMMGSNSVSAKNDNRLALLIDNLRVYECDEQGNKITDADKEAVKSVKAVGYDGSIDELLNVSSPEIPADTKQIDITFSSPVSASIKNQRAVALMRHYDDRSEYLNSGLYTGEISEDGLTYSIKFTNNGYLENESEYALAVSDLIEFADNSSSQLAKMYKLKFTVKESADKGLGVTRFSIKKPITANTNITGDDGAGVKKPIVRLEDVDAETKIYISGFNTVDKSSMVVVAVGYKDEGENRIPTLKNVSQMNVYSDIPYGEFNKEIDVGEFDEDIQYIKVYAWDYPSMKPLVRNIYVK